MRSTACENGQWETGKISWKNTESKFVNVLVVQQLLHASWFVFLILLIVQVVSQIQPLDGLSLVAV